MSARPGWKEWLMIAVFAPLLFILTVDLIGGVIESYGKYVRTESIMAKDKGS